jgi:hypothetical protein
VLTIGVFDQRLPETASKEKAVEDRLKYVEELIKVRVTDPVDGSARIVMYQTRQEAYGGHDAYMHNDTSRANLFGKLGVASTRMVYDKDSTFSKRIVETYDPIIALHAPVCFVLDDGRTITSDGIVGYVETRTGELLLDGAQ